MHRQILCIETSIIDGPEDDVATLPQDHNFPVERLRPIKYQEQREGWENKTIRNIAATEPSFITFSSLITKWSGHPGVICTGGSTGGDGVETIGTTGNCFTAPVKGFSKLQRLFTKLLNKSFDKIIQLYTKFVYSLCVQETCFAGSLFQPLVSHASIDH